MSSSLVQNINSRLSQAVPACGTGNIYTRNREVVLPMAPVRLLTGLLSGSKRIQMIYWPAILTGIIFVPKTVRKIHQGTTVILAPIIAVRQEARVVGTAMLPGVYFTWQYGITGLTL